MGRTSKKKLLIVDDAKLFLRSFRRLLCKEGYDVTTAEDGLEAMEHLQKEAFDLVVTDIEMPRMNGIDMLKKIKTPETKGPKREAFVKKEKKKAAFKPKLIDKKVKKTTPKPKAPVNKTAPAKPKEQPVIKEKAPKKEKVKVEKKGMPLNVLTGLGITTAKKFETVGINSVEELIVETPEEIAKMIKGASEAKIITWINEGKKLLEESK